jgi:hypothetical protein
LAFIIASLERVMASVVTTKLLWQLSCFIMTFFNSSVLRLHFGKGLPVFGTR